MTERVEHRAPIPLAEDAVERLARVLYERDGDAGLIRSDWDTDNDGMRDQYRQSAREALMFALLPPDEEAR